MGISTRTIEANGISQQIAPLGQQSERLWLPLVHPSNAALASVANEMALSVLAYNLTRVINIVGTRALLAAIRA